VRKRGRIRVLLLAVVAALAVGIGLVTYSTKLFRSVELSSVDARFTVRGTEKPPSDLVVVGVDHTTLQDLNTQWPYPRSYFGKVIERLKADGAKVVAVDVIFAEPSRDQKRYCGFAGDTLPRDDCALLVATNRARNVVFSATEVGDKGNVPYLGAPNGKQVLSVIGARAGYTGVADDPNGTLRRYPAGFSGLKSFASVANERATGKPVPASIFPKSDHTGDPLADRITWIDYYGPPGTIPEVAFSKVMKGQTPPGYFKGKTVVVGATDPTLKDVFFVPTSGDQLMSGPELQAHAIGTVRRGNPLGTVAGGWNVGLIILLALIAPLACLALGLRGLLVPLVAGVAFLVAAQLLFDGGHIVAFVYPLLALVVGTVGSLAVQYFTETRERARTKLLFSRFVPENVVDQVLDQADDALRLGGVQREGTVMFSDLRGFTSFAESLPVERVIEVLNIYLGEMSAAILDNGGTLVAYMGDGIMAVFGAPIQQADHADRALTAAREMLGPRLATFNSYLRAEGLGEGFRMGVGLNSGHVMSGNVGSERRLEYTAIGDTTNTAARLEGMTKGTPHQLFMSQATVDLIRSQQDDLVLVGEFEVRGRTQKITLWSIEDSDGSAPVAAAAAPATAG
jgi:adenylate cyclase